ncbi:MAG: hypothetical protein CBR30_01485 [Dictyoglomus sp. NZ13-RE01]|nr:MAG: hypothetical protein CBR30_01485 [Dictyoglomus sp. NZ13-RE01]
MNRDLLLHICCAVCLIYPLEKLRENGYDVKGFWYNPNIHPYQEYKMRLETLKNYASMQNLELIVNDDYDLEGFIRNVVYRENERCPVCYYMRLKKTVETAKDLGFNRFTTTLLMSPYQKHDLIFKIGKMLENEYNIEFVYYDYRSEYRTAINKAKELNLYRQKYCGCIYSEKERYWKGEKK